MEILLLRWYCCSEHDIFRCAVSLSSVDEGVGLGLLTQRGGTGIEWEK